MTLRCFGCNIEKDMDILEFYTYEEGGLDNEEPVQPLHVLEVSPNPIYDTTQYKVTVVCHECFRQLDPDMWISERCWISINPCIPFSRLPLPLETSGKWNPENYMLEPLEEMAAIELPPLTPGDSK